jgi:hypothetical protein
VIPDDRSLFVKIKFIEFFHESINNPIPWVELHIRFRYTNIKLHATKPL